MDVPGPFVKDENKGMGEGNSWNPGGELDEPGFAAAVNRLAELAGKPVPPIPNDLTWETIGPALDSLDPGWRKKVPQSGPVLRGDFALAAAEILKATGRPALMTDAAVPAPGKPQ